MNKRELVDAVGELLPSKKIAGQAVEAVLETIQATVAKGEKVSITGFGTFEKADRAVREGRNPSTGATIHVPATSVPKFKAGTEFKARVASGR